MENNSFLLWLLNISTTFNVAPIFHSTLYDVLSGCKLFQEDATLVNFLWWFWMDRKLQNWWVKV